MRYVLLIYCDEDAAVSDRERGLREEQFTAALDGLRAHGVLADGQRLRPARAARIVRCWDGGDIIVTDGPAAQTQEQLTGWIIAECGDPQTTVRLATTIDQTFRRGTRVTEKMFHDELEKHLRADPELGGRLTRCDAVARGFDDLLPDDVIAELKVKRDKPVAVCVAATAAGPPLAAGSEGRAEQVAVSDIIAGWRCNLQW